MDERHIKVRRAADGDLGEIVRIYNQSVTGGVATFDLTPFTTEERRPWFDQFGTEYPLLVAELGGRVSGYAYYLPYRAKPAYARTRECTVYVDESSQGKGIGVALYEALIGEARNAGLHVLIGVIADGNPASVALHRKFGFKLVGRLEEVGWKFDRWVGTEFYQKLL